MSYFLLPNMHINDSIININLKNTIRNTTFDTSNCGIIPDNLKIDMPNHIYISKSLYYYLNRTKNQINNSYDEWDFIKRHTNPYEFIHTNVSIGVPAICKMKPLSRSFYKMVEICSELKLLEKYNNCNMKTFHLAEGPGGFIEALTYLRSNNEDQYYGMTLIDANDYVPGWKKSKTFLENHNNVNIETGSTGNGDLLQKENLLYCYEKYKNTMDLITADGGFDFSIDFNKQELVASKLLFAQVVFALAMQKNGGEFVLKVFDIFTKSTVDILYLLSTLYDSVYIMKPNTSRIANSERYIICKKFVKPKQYDSLMNRIIDNYHQVNTMDYITSIFDFSLNYYFINKLEEYNAILGQQQIENIMYTINLLQSRQKNEKIESHKRNNINKCVMWCAKYRLPHYNDSNINTVSNRFIPDMIKVDENRQCDNSVNMVA